MFIFLHQGSYDDVISVRDELRRAGVNTFGGGTAEGDGFVLVLKEDFPRALDTLSLLGIEYRHL